MDTVIIIPARWKSSRFPGKPLANILGKTLIQRVWDQCTQVPAVDVYVATDSEKIRQYCKKNNIEYIMTSKSCETGTDRVVEAYQKLGKKYKTIVNVQGDEPLVTPEDIIKVYKSNPGISCGQCRIENVADFVSPNVIKVVTDVDGYMLYASRSPIPINKSFEFTKAYRQVCIYSFSDSMLSYFSSDRTPLESIEDVELLRLVEKGFKIKMVNVSGASAAVDVPEDVDKIKDILFGS